MANKKSILTFIGISLIALGFVLGRYAIPSNDTLAETDDNGPSVEVKCEENVKLYKEIEGKKIYVKCIDNLQLKLDAGKVSLKDYLNANSINSLINLLTFDSALNDGGTMIYKDGGTKKITDKGITVIKCNKLSPNLNEPNNQDIYIGLGNMQYEESFCKSEDAKSNIGKDLIHTYEVLNIAESNEAEYLWLTIRQYTKEDVTSVRVPKELAKNVKTKKNYEFNFKITDDSIDFDDTKKMFDTFELIKIQETDKLGVDQINQIIEN